MELVTEHKKSNVMQKIWVFYTSCLKEGQRACYVTYLGMHTHVQHKQCTAHDNEAHHDVFCGAERAQTRFQCGHFQRARQDPSNHGGMRQGPPRLTINTLPLGSGGHREPIASGMTARALCTSLLEAYFKIRESPAYSAFETVGSQPAEATEPRTVNGVAHGNRLLLLLRMKRRLKPSLVVDWNTIGLVMFHVAD